MKDFDGVKIEVGDRVVLMTAPGEYGSVFLMNGIVEGFTPKKVRVKMRDGKILHRMPHRIGVMGPRLARREIPVEKMVG